MRLPFCIPQVNAETKLHRLFTLERIDELVKEHGRDGKALGRGIRQPQIDNHETAHPILCVVEFVDRYREWRDASRSAGSSTSSPAALDIGRQDEGVLLFGGSRQIEYLLSILNAQIENSNQHNPCYHEHHSG